MTYITQDSLILLVCSIPGFRLLGREVRVPETRFRWDAVFNRGNRTVVLEFDGYQHYQNALIMKADAIKDDIARGMNYTVVRWPYWIQPTTKTLSYLLSATKPHSQKYKHGFIDKKAVFPASFCSLGRERFDRELRLAPEEVRDQVAESLKLQSSIYGSRFVW